MLFRKEQQAADPKITLPSQERLMPVVEGLMDSIMKRVDKNNDGVLSEDEFILCTKILRKEWSSVLKLTDSPSKQRVNAMERQRSNSAGSSTRRISQARESIPTNIIPKKYVLSKAVSMERNAQSKSNKMLERQRSRPDVQDQEGAGKISSFNIKQVRLRKQIGDLLASECRKAIQDWEKTGDLEKFMHRLKTTVNATQNHVVSRHLSPSENTEEHYI